MKLKTLSGDKTPISVELVDFSSEQFKGMPEDERKKWEQKLELAVTTLVLSSSRKGVRPVYLLMKYLKLSA